MLLWAAGLAHVVAGNVDYGLMGNILVGSVPGVIVGERLSRSVPAGGLRPALGATMLAAALGVASKAGLDLPAYAIVGPPLLALALAYWLSRNRALRAEAAADLERDVAVLALRALHALGPQRLERRDQLRARLVRHDHVVDVAALGRRVRVREARLVVVDQLRRGARRASASRRCRAGG